MNKSEKISLLSSIVVIGFAFGVIFYYCLGQYLNLPYPFNTFLFLPKSAFTDFTSIIPLIKNFAPYQNISVNINYFPLAYILVFPLILVKNEITSYLILASGFMTFLTFMNIKNFTCENLTKLQNFQNIFILTLMPYPVLVALDRGNLDMLLVAFFTVFIYLFKEKKYILSAIVLAIENAIKPFPILFLTLFLFKKKYKEFFLSLLLTALLIITGFMVLKGNFFDQIIIFIKDLLVFNNAYIYDTTRTNGMINSSSLFMALKLLLCQEHNLPVNVLLKFYNYLSIICLPVILFFTWREKIFWKQLTLLTIGMLLFPYVIIDYKLCFLFIPIWFFVNDENKSNMDLIYTIFFGLLMIPKNIVVLTHVGNLAKLTSYGIIINPIIMLLLASLIIYEQFQLKKTV